MDRAAARLAPLAGLGLGAALWASGRTAAGALTLGLASASLLASLVAPTATARALDAVARAVARVVTVVALTAVYLLVFVPLRVVGAVGRDPLRRRFDRGAASYWTPRAGRPARPDRPF